MVCEMELELTAMAGDGATRAKGRHEVNNVQQDDSEAMAKVRNRAERQWRDVVGIRWRQEEWKKSSALAIDQIYEKGIASHSNTTEAN